MEKFRTAFSREKNITSALADIHDQFKGFNPKLVMYFTSSNHPQQELAQRLNNAFDCETFGCSTSGEIITGQMLDDSIVVMGYGDGALLDFKVEVCESMTFDNVGVRSAFNSFEEYFGEPAPTMDYKRFLGIVLVGGLSKKEEIVMDRIGDRTNVLFVGGSAGDDLKFKETYVHANGKVFTNGNVIVLLEPKVKFSVLKTQSFTKHDKKLTVTKAKVKEREILEFNNKPATEAYAEALGVAEAELPKHVFKNPVGLMHGDEPFVRSPQQIKGKSMYFYCSMMEGMELELLKSGNIIKDTQKALDQKLQEFGPASAIVNFHCILRTLELKESELTKEYGHIFSQVPTVGFSTYGECYLGHINQTSTILIFE